MKVEKNVKGILIPIGGSEDKGEKSNTRVSFREKGVLRHVLNEAKGEDSKVVVIPTASRIPDEVGQNYISAFRKLGCEKVTVLPISRKNHSENQDFIRQIRDADCILFTGGNQSRIETKIRNSTLHRIIIDRFENEPIVIAGTSAGAMAMASEMIAGGTSSGAMLKGAVKMKDGLGLFPDAIIDTHFIKRGRFGRLFEALARFPDKVGIGLADDTGLITKNLNDCQVIGSGMVLFLDPSGLSHNSYDLLKPNTPISVAGMKVHILANGDRINLSTREVEVLPMTESFV